MDQESLWGTRMEWVEKGRKGEREESGGNGWSAGPCGGRGEGSENGGVVYLACPNE